MLTAQKREEILALMEFHAARASTQVAAAKR